MTTRQLGYLWGECYPAIAEGIDILLINAGRRPWGWDAKAVHERWKDSIGVESLTQLSKKDGADYITELQAFAASCLIYVGTPEDWLRGIDERERMAHYAYVLDNEGDGLRRAA